MLRDQILLNQKCYSIHLFILLNCCCLDCFGGNPFDVTVHFYIPSLCYCIMIILHSCLSIFIMFFVYIPFVFFFSYKWRDSVPIHPVVVLLCDCKMFLFLSLIFAKLCFIYIPFYVYLIHMTWLFTNRLLHTLSLCNCAMTIFCILVYSGTNVDTYQLKHT